MAGPNDLKNIFVRAGGASFQVKLYRQGRRISVTFDSLAEAQTYRDTLLANKTSDKLQREIMDERAERTANKTFTLHAALDRFKKEISDTQASKSDEQTRIGKLQRQKIAHLNFYAVQPTHVYELLKEIGGTSENQRHYALLLSKVFKKAKKVWGMKVANPIADIELPGKNKPRERRVSPAEYNKIVEHIPADVLSVIIIALETAARRGEILNALRCDLNIKGCALLLRKTKNGDQRILPLSTRAIKILKNIKGDSEKLFENVTVSRLRYCWEQMRIKTGLPDLHFHDLRHEATSRLVENGKLNLLEVASVTGHRDLGMLKRYTHLNPSNIARKLG